MKNIIYKYQPFRFSNGSVVMEDGAKIVKLGMQDGIITFWAIVEAGVELRERQFHTVGTGQIITKDNWKYVGTVFDGNFVWHIFEEE